MASQVTAPDDISLDTILVVIPALDEAATIQGVIQALQAVGLDHIRVVDNGSRDRTAAVASQAGAEVMYEPTRGYGQACWTGLQELPPDIEWILFCDADGSDDLTQLPDLIAGGATCDFILGNRRGTALGRLRLTPVQNFGNWLASTLIEWGWGYCYHDLGPLRLIRRQALEQICMGDRGFGWTVEMQTRAVECGLRICEIPVHYRPRQGGQSKISGTVSGSLRAGTIILTTLARLYGRTFAATTSETSTSEASTRVSTTNERTQAALLFVSAFLLVMGSVWCAPHGDFLNDPTAVPQFWRGISAMLVGFGLSWWLRSLSAWWFWGVAIVPRLVLLSMHPSDDIWRYLWEGYIQTQGFSPYDYSPNAEVLAPLRTVWWQFINHPDVSAIYPPVTQLGFRLLSTLNPSVLLFKLTFVAADLGICGLLSQRFGYRATLLYAWNPLVIYSFAGGGHYDSWFLLPLVAAWLWFERPYPDLGRSAPPRLHWLGSACLLGISIAVKWMSLPVLGFLAWQSLKCRRWRLTVGVLLVGMLPFILTAFPFCGVQSCPLVPTGSVFVNYGRSAELIPYMVARVWEASRWNNHLYALPLGLLVGWQLWRTARFGKFTEHYLIGLLLLSPIVHGWYFTWLVPFAVASRNGGTRLVSLSAFVYFSLPYRAALGDANWLLTPVERGWLWLPFVIGMMWTSFSHRGLRPGSDLARYM